MELEQPISNLIKGFRNYKIKWGSKTLNDDTFDYNSLRDYFDDKDHKIMNLINGLCNNTVVGAMAISALLKFIYMDYERAVEKGDEELKYVCWVRYHKTLGLADAMNLGSGSFGRSHATFDNISSYTARGIHNLFLIHFKDNLSDIDLNRLESIEDSFNISDERKEEIRKICGDPFSVQVDPYNSYSKTYKANEL